MSDVILKIHNTTTTLREVELSNNDTTVIEAKSHVNYELHNKEEDYAPQHIVNQRVDSDLHIFLDKTVDKPSVIIRGFYNFEEQGVIGISEEGAYYHYIPDTAEVEDYVTLLSDGDMEGQALGGNMIVASEVDDSEKATTFLDDLSSMMYVPLLAVAAVPIFFHKDKRQEVEKPAQAVETPESSETSAKNDTKESSESTTAQTSGEPTDKDADSQSVYTLPTTQNIALDLNKIQDVEKLDMTNEVAQNLSLSASDVLTVTGDTNILFVDGDAKDTVELTDLTAADTNTNSQEGYSAYTGSVGEETVTVYLQDIII